MDPYAHAAQIVLSAARILAADAPNKTATVTLCALVYHTPTLSPDTVMWGIQVGHTAALNAPTLQEAMAKLKAIGSPETKRAKAAELRKQAEALEAEASIVT